MSAVEIITVGGTALSGINTFLIWQLMQRRDGQIAKLTSALLHTVGETRAADVVSTPAPRTPKGQPTPLPQQRPRQIGLTPR